MKNIDYSKQLDSFVAEVINMAMDEFKNQKIGPWYTNVKWCVNRIRVTNEVSRSLLHEIGQKHGLVPLCPDDVIYLKLSQNHKPKE